MEIEKLNKILIPISAVCIAYIFMTFSLEFFYFLKLERTDITKLLI